MSKKKVTYTGRDFDIFGKAEDGAVLICKSVQPNPTFPGGGGKFDKINNVEFMAPGKEREGVTTRATLLDLFEKYEIPEGYEVAEFGTSERHDGGEQGLSEGTVAGDLNEKPADDGQTVS
jgi:hypothetical protein